VLESGFCGSGASSRNAGQFTGPPAGDPRLLGLLYRRRLRNIVRFAQGSVHFVKNLLARINIDCDYDATGNVLAATSKAQLRKAARNARILHKAGANVRFGDSRELGLTDSFHGGVLEALGGLMNPGKFALGIRQALIRMVSGCSNETLCKLSTTTAPPQSSKRRQDASVRIGSCSRPTPTRVSSRSPLVGLRPPFGSR